MKTKKQNRMYGMICRARRKGSDVHTKKRTIYRSYKEADTPQSRQEDVLIREYNFGIQLLLK